MKTVPITELRRRISDVIEELQDDDEPTVVLQRSRKAAYIVNPERFERDQAELRSLRHELFVAGVREAEAEIAAGKAKTYDNVEDLIRDIWG
jgi:prevent-host-death family protein